jgi:hypothetical protein
VEQLEKAIADRTLRQVYRRPQVTVTVKRSQEQKVLVMGEVGGTEAKAKARRVPVNRKDNPYGNTHHGRRATKTPAAR